MKNYCGGEIVLAYDLVLHTVVRKDRASPAYDDVVPRSQECSFSHLGTRLQNCWHKLVCDNVVSSWTFLPQHCPKHNSPLRPSFAD